jgi:hypothetical protein
MNKEKQYTQEDLDNAYLNGRKQLLLSQLQSILGELGSKDFDKERLTLEREQAIISLRSACQDYGSNDWPSDLHLSDIIDKHLMRYLTPQAEAYNKGVKEAVTAMRHKHVLSWVCDEVEKELLNK